MIRRVLLQNFKLLHRLDRWVNRRWTPAGVLVMVTMFSGAVFGLDVRSTFGFRLAGFAFALLVLAALWSLWFRAKVSVSRTLPAYATVGEPLSYTLSVRNHRARAERGLSFREHLKERLPSYAEFVAAVEPGGRSRNLFDRRVGYPRWAWLVRLGRGAQSEACQLETLPASGTAQVNLRLTALRRGRIRLEGIEVSRTDPCGLLRAIKRLGEPASLLALPKRYPVTWCESVGASRDVVGGDNLSSLVGDSDEFSTVREYRAGDPLRHIHWRSWARSGEPIVKTFQQQSFVRQALVLDTFTTIASSQQFEEAVSVIASFAYQPDRSSAEVRLFFRTEGLSFDSFGMETEGILEALACVQPCPQVELDALRDLVLENSASISACICVLLAWDQERQALVERVRAAGIPVTVFVVSSLAESELVPGPLADEPGRLCHIETGQAARVLLAYDPNGVNV